MQTTYQSKILDHLGLVAAMFDELQIAPVIDQAIAQDHPQRTVSIGQAVKAMVLNGLGFVNQRLYLMPQFFETKPTERLIGPGIQPEHLNDDTLGRALDALYDYGVTELFRDVAAHAALELGFKPRFAHLDATSFHLDGRYNSDEEAIEEGVIHIRQGYSRDHRPELNQVVLELMVEQQAGLPLLMEPLSGNSSDAGDFPKLIAQHLDALQLAHGVDYIVADSALYGADHIQRLDGRGAKFITRVPETVGEAKRALAEADLAAFEPLNEGYQGLVLPSSYGGVAQRWLVVHSEAAQGRARTGAAKALQRQSEHDLKAFEKLRRRRFACRADAEAALHAFADEAQVSHVEGGHIIECAHYEGLEGVGKTPVGTSYCIDGRLASRLACYQEALMRRSLFLLATNESDEAALSNEDMLMAYKGQVRVERGFRFLKDPLFLASSLFLKNEKRIMALLMVMTLCLLVYAALEHRIRAGLHEQEESFPDQKGKPTQRPTARWVFQSFVGIHVLLVEQQALVLNLKAHHEVLIGVLGHEYAQYYSSHIP